MNSYFLEVIVTKEAAADMVIPPTTLISDQAKRAFARELVERMQATVTIESVRERKVRRLQGQVVTWPPGMENFRDDDLVVTTIVVLPGYYRPDERT